MTVQLLYTNVKRNTSVKDLLGSGCQEFGKKCIRIEKVNRGVLIFLRESNLCVKDPLEHVACAVEFRSGYRGEGPRGPARKPHQGGIKVSMEFLRIYHHGEILSFLDPD